MNIINSSNVILDQVRMSNGKSVNNGGAFYVKGNSLGSIRIKNCNRMIEYFEAIEGGFIYIDNPNFKFSTSQCDWRHLKARDKGGFIAGYQMQDFSIS
jgi:hypothetical protein